MQVKSCSRPYAHLTALLRLRGVDMKTAQKRKAGEILRRGGISQRIINIANDIAAGTYKNAIEKAGRIAVLVEAASYDSYWDEKALIGRHSEEGVLEHLTSGAIDREKLICTESNK